MKISLLTLLMGIAIGSTFAQDPDLKVTASAGNSYTAGNFQLDWTLGEPVILTLENSPIILSEGFHQPTYDVISAVINPSWIETFSISPNPCEDKVNIHLQLLTAEHGVLEVYDMSGKYILRETFSDITIDKHYNISELPAGQYRVRASVPGQHKIQNLSFIKL